MAPDPTSQPSDLIRLVLQQRAMPKYRVPVFRELSRRPGIDLTVVHGIHPELPNGEADDFDARCEPMWRGHLAGRELFWHGAQWRYATRSTTDVLLMDGSLQHTALVPALLRARARGVPTILWTHGYSKKDARWRRWLRIRLPRLATAMLYYNRETADQYIDMGLDPRRVFVAVNCLDQAPIEKARNAWRTHGPELERFNRDHGLEPGPVVLFVSRLLEENRIDLLLHAGARLVPRFPSLRIVIIGKGPDEERLRGLAATLRLDEHTRFPGAIYDEMELAPWFLAARAYCYPANIGLSVLHSFGYGLPVVTSDRITAQNPEIVSLRDGENGFLYTDGDAGALASRLERLFSDVALQQAMSRDAEATVRDRYSLARMVDGMEAAVHYCHQRSRRGAIE